MMATRCHLVLVDGAEHIRGLYRHWDGYPSHMEPQCAAICAWELGLEGPDRIRRVAAAIVALGEAEGKAFAFGGLREVYEDGHKLHGDEQFAYVVDLVRKRFQTVPLGFGDPGRKQALIDAAVRFALHPDPDPADVKTLSRHVLPEHTVSLQVVHGFERRWAVVVKRPFGQVVRYLSLDSRDAANEKLIHEIRVCSMEALAKERALINPIEGESK